MPRPIPELTRDQEDWICYQIGQWYYKWKGRIVDPGVEHCLGAAKEDLKNILCAETNNNTKE